MLYFSNHVYYTSEHWSTSSMYDGKQIQIYLGDGLMMMMKELAYRNNYKNNQNRRRYSSVF